MKKPGEPTSGQAIVNAPFPKGLYALCDDTYPTPAGLLAQAEQLLEGGVKVLQLRMKRTTGKAALAVAREVTRACRAVDAVCIINDRVDLCLLADAHGVHLGDEDLPPAEARALLGPERLMGVTVRDAAGARAAAAAGASYVGAGPLFGTTSKKVDAPVMGLTALEVLVRESPLPVVAIGGIGLERMSQVAATGTHGAAVLGDLLGAEDVASRARQLAAAFAAGTRP